MASESTREIIQRHRDEAAASGLANLTVRAETPYKIGDGNTARPWRPPKVSGDTAAAMSSELGLPRVRDAIRNGPQFQNALAKLVELVVGVGVRAYCHPFSMGLDIDDARLDAELDYANESDVWFERWASDPDQCDFKRKQTWWELQRSAFGECPSVGAAILVRCNERRAGRMIPGCFQLVELEQLDKTKDRSASAANGTKIVNGIELDRFDREIGFWVHDFHPDDSSFGPPGTGSTFIPAERVIHPFIPTRPSDNTGFTWFAPLGQGTRDRGWVLENYLYKVAIDAAMTLVQKGDEQPDVHLSGEASVDEQGRPIVTLAQGGMTIRVPKGEEIEMFQSDGTPPPGVDKLLDVIDHDAASGIGLSHIRYTGRWDKQSYSSGRGATLDDEAHCRPLRQFWGARFVRPVRALVNQQMIAMGRLTTITGAQFRRNPWQYNNFVMIGPGREMLDPEGETDSARAKLGAFLSTLQLELGKLGLHWVHVLHQIRLEERILERFGLRPEFSKGGGQQAGTRQAGESRQEMRERARGEADTAQRIESARELARQAVGMIERGELVA